MINLSQTANIEHLDYAIGKRRKPVDDLKWYNNFIGFIQFTDLNAVINDGRIEHECWIGYQDRNDNTVRHVPLYIGYHEEEIESETYTLKKTGYVDSTGNSPEEYIKTNPWVLMFYGNDNSSYFFRFENKKAIEYFIEHFITDSFQETLWDNVMPVFGYNS